MAISKIILNGVIQMDVTDDTVVPSNLLSGEQATANNGNKVQGSIPSKIWSDITISNTTVTVPAGFYEDPVSVDVDGNFIIDNTDLNFADDGNGNITITENV